MINFINPRSPFLEREDMMPPLGLMSLVAVLKKAGIPARIIDQGLGDQIPDGELFITATTPQFTEATKLVRRPYTVIGGPHASINGDWIDDNLSFSAVVMGEGEEVIEHIARNKPLGIIKAPRIKDLDSLPFPDRIDAHRYNWLIEGKKATTMMTSRGCNGACAFCCKAVMSNGIYFRSATSVIEEVRQLRQEGFGAVMFYDDSIAMKKKRLIEICNGLEKIDIIWRCFVRSDQVDFDIFQRMAWAGCVEVLIGVESGSNKILKNIHKHETAEMHLKAVSAAKRAGIKVKALMIAGLPGENWGTIEDSRRFILQAKPDSLDITVLQVYQGCPIQRNPHKYDLSFSDPSWYKGRNDEYSSTVFTSAMTGDEILVAREYLWNTFKRM